MASVHLLHHDDGTATGDAIVEINDVLMQEPHGTA